MMGTGLVSRKRLFFRLNTYSQSPLDSKWCAFLGIDSCAAVALGDEIFNRNEVVQLKVGDEIEVIIPFPWVEHVCGCQIIPINQI